MQPRPHPFSSSELSRRANDNDRSSLRHLAVQRRKVADPVDVSQTNRPTFDQCVVPDPDSPNPANKLQSLPACQTEAVLLRLAQDLLVVLTEPAVELAERGLLCSLSAR